MLTRRVFLLIVVAWLAIGASLAAITVTRVTVASTATVLYTAATGGSSVLLRNAGAASVFLGDVTVTATTGFEVVAGDAVTLPLGPGDTLYGIVATGTNRVDVMESRR